MLWQSTVLRRLWHRITDATQQDAAPLTSTKNRKARLEFTKKHKVEPEGSFGTLFMDRWDKDEPLSKWWESKNVEKKGNCKWSQAYSLICKAWWRWCHGMGIHGSGTGPLNFTDDSMMTAAELIWKGTKPSYLPISKKMPPDSLGSASYCIRTMTQNTLPVQSRNL